MILLCLGISASILGGQMVYNIEFSTSQVAFDEFASGFFARIDVEFRHQIRMIEMLGVTMSLKPDMSLIQYQLFAKHISDGHTWARSMNWMPRVPRHQRREFEEKNRREYHDETIAMKDIKGNVLPYTNDSTLSASHDFYPVGYVQPIEGNFAAIGLEVTSNEDRFATLNKAASTAATIATPVIDIFQVPDKSNDNGIVLYHPVYQPLCKHTISDAHIKLFIV